MILARRSVSYAAAAVADADGIKTSFNTTQSAVQLVPADFNGGRISAAGVLDLPRIITITLSNNANQFSLGDYVITGLRGGATVSQTKVAANNDGNVVLRFTQPFDSIATIDLPVMDGTGGTITIGVEDICAPYGDVFSGVELAATGTLNVGYGGTDLVPSNIDAIPIGAAQVGFVKPISPKRIITDASVAAPTTVGLTVYLG